MEKVALVSHWEKQILERDILISKLKLALIGIVGASEIEELKNMKEAMRLLPVGDEAERTAIINAINVLMEIQGV